MELGWPLMPIKTSESCAWLSTAPMLDGAKRMRLAYEMLETKSGGLPARMGTLSFERRRS